MNAIYELATLPTGDLLIVPAGDHSWSCLQIHDGILQNRDFCLNWIHTFFQNTYPGFSRKNLKWWYFWMLWTALKLFERNRFQFRHSQALISTILLVWDSNIAWCRFLHINKLTKCVNITLAKWFSNMPKTTVHQTSTY